MERVPHIEAAPPILNEGVGVGGIPSFLRRIHSRLDDDDYRFPYYMEWLAEVASMSARNQIGPDSLESLQGYLEITDPQSDEFDQERVEELRDNIPPEDFRFYLVYVLCKMYLELGEIDNAQQTVEQFRDEFGDRPLYRVIRADILSERDNQDLMNSALEEIWEAKTEFPEHAEVQKSVASVVAKAIEKDILYDGYLSEIPTERDSLLQVAKEAIQQALDIAPDHPEYLLIKGKVQGLDNRFSAARKSIRKAIENLNPRRPAYDRVLSEFRLELSNMDLLEQENALKRETTEALRQLEELRENYENASQEFQTRVLQFLGFFTGLIGIVIISAQVTLSATSFTVAARLILVLVGGLLFAFGGFSFVLPVEDNRISWRVFGVLISGAILIITGISIPLWPI